MLLHLIFVRPRSYRRIQRASQGSFARDQEKDSRCRRVGHAVLPLHSIMDTFDNFRWNEKVAMDADNPKVVECETLRGDFQQAENQRGDGR